MDLEYLLINVQNVANLIVCSVLRILAPNVKLGIIWIQRQMFVIYVVNLLIIVLNALLLQMIQYNVRAVWLHSLSIKINARDVFNLVLLVRNLSVLAALNHSQFTLMPINNALDAAKTLAINAHKLILKSAWSVERVFI